MPPDVTCVASTLMQQPPSLFYKHKHKQTASSVTSLSILVFHIMSFLDYCFRSRGMERRWPRWEMNTSWHVICVSSKMYMEGLRDGFKLTPSGKIGLTQSCTGPGFKD